MSDVVIGGGIVGASCAYHLATRGRNVTLVDSDLSGNATGAGAGIVSALDTSGRGHDWDRFGTAAAAYYPQLASELEHLGHRLHGWTRAGQLIVGNTELQLVADRANEIADRYGDAALGRPEWLDLLSIADLWPGLRADRAVLLDRVGRVDGRRFRTALIKGMRQLGGRITEGTASLTQRGRTVDVHIGPDTLAGDAVIVAAGAWCGQLLEPLGISGCWIAPQRGQILHARMPGVVGRPIVSAPNRNYLLAFPDDRLVFGATREDGSGFDPRVTVGGQHWLATWAVDLVPGIADATVIETRVGLRPQSKDGLPVLGKIPGTDNLFLAGGLGHTGLTLGPYSGRVLADLIDGDPRATELPDAFLPDRFLPHRGDGE